MHWWFLPGSITIMWWLIFFCNFTSSTFIITVKMNHLPFSSICLFLSVWTHRFICYSKGYHHLLWYFILMLKLSRFGQWKSLHNGSHIHLTCPHHSLSTSLFLAQRYSMLILYFPCPDPGISHFSTEPCSFLWRKAFRS